jgi:predicted nucleic acid-binding protein
VGSLKLPAKGLVYVDANVVIYSVEKIPGYWPVLESLWDAVDAGLVRVASSQLLVLEVLVGPLKRRDAGLISTYDAILRSGELELSPISDDILRRAADLRATHGVRTPDAIHAATALSLGCTVCITNDAGFRRIPGLPVEVLKDVIASP